MSFVVSIDLGDGRVDEVKISPNTNLSVLANRFCVKHNLPNEAQSILIEEIKRNCSNLTPSPKKSQDESILSTNFTTAEKYSNQNIPRKAKFSNPGEKLYEKGLRYLEIISSKLEKFKKMQEENEKSNLTFSPKINRSKHRSSIEALLLSGLKTEEKLEKMRGEKLNNEINQCTFSPSISRNSSRLVEKRRSLSPEKLSVNTCDLSFATTKSAFNRGRVFQELFEEAKTLQEKKRSRIITHLNTHCTFRPDTSATEEIDKKLLEKRGKYQRISDSRKQILHYLRLQALNTDLQTGQQLFKPKISEYKAKGIEKTPKESYISRSFSHKRSFSHRLTSANSEKLLKRLKYLRFKAIFETLSPEKATVNYYSVKNSKISSNLAKILEPLIMGLEKTKLELNFEQFCTEMEELLKISTPESRNFIFKGQIEEVKRSQSQHVKKNIDFGIYERNVERLKQKQRKILFLQNEKIEEEKALCTFTPVIRSYSPTRNYPEIWSLNSRLSVM